MMDIERLLSTIEDGFAVGYAWADKKALVARKQLEESQAALNTLRQHIEAQAKLLEQAQTVASQQQATLEKVTGEYRALSDAVAELKRIEDSPEYEADGSWKDWDTAYDNMYRINRKLRGDTP